MRTIEKEDRIHVYTASSQWTMMRTPQQERGICAISDVRHLKTGDQLVQDRGNFSINDPKSGGLFAFGFIVADSSNPRFPQKDEFWNWAWEITSKRTQSPGFGVLSSMVEHVDEKVIANQSLGIMDTPICTVDWTYDFKNSNYVRATIEIMLLPREGLFIKEPKIVCNGLSDYTNVYVYNQAGRLLKQGDLTRQPDPKRRTFQINPPGRYKVKFLNSRTGSWADFTNDHGLDIWYARANKGNKMYPDAGPLTVGKGKYCMPKDELLAQWEVPYWPKEKISGLAMHVWEGGYGAPDCWNCFRPWPNKILRYKVNLEARFGHA